MMTPIIAAVAIIVIDDADWRGFDDDHVPAIWVVRVIVGSAMDHDFVLDAAGQEHRHGQDGEKE
jgi:hypothetical protein